jgi:hypothetical protein
MNFKFAKVPGFVVVLLAGQALVAAEVRTYQFVGDGSRPFLYDSSWGLQIDAPLVGTFDLVTDPVAGTAQLTNINTYLGEPAKAPPRQNEPLSASDRAYFVNKPLTTVWRTNLIALTGHFIAPDLIEFAGPSAGLYYKRIPNYDRPVIGYPSGGFNYIPGYNTAMQIALDGDQATINAVSTDIVVNDIPFYYLLNARATVVPEPSVAILLVGFGVPFYALCGRRR